MKIERDGESVRLVVDRGELRLLRRALERALFIDTPVAEQEDIAGFCSRVLESLPAAS